MTAPQAGGAQQTREVSTSEQVANVLGEIDGTVTPLPPGRGALREFFVSVSGLDGGRRRRYQAILRRQIRSRKGFVRLCFGLSLGGLVYQAQARRAPSEMPLELQAEWTTSTPGYADRPFWIGHHQIAFRVGPAPNDINVYNVTHVDSIPMRGDTTRYDIEYAVDGGKSRWSIRHSQLPQPEIVFIHQPQIHWGVKPDLHPPVR